MSQTDKSRPAATAAPPTTDNTHIRVEEKLVDVEVVSYSGSSDVSETEEHVTVHAKREPLPWSMRGAAYDKPLPGVTSDRAPSPLPAISPVQQKSPLHTFFGPTISGSDEEDTKTEKEEEKGATNGDGPAEEAPSQSVGRRFRDLTSIPVPGMFISPPGASSASPSSASSFLPSAPVINISSPVSTEHQRSPALVRETKSPVHKAPTSPVKETTPSVPVLERSPSPLQLSSGAASSSEVQQPSPKQDRSSSPGQQSPVSSPRAASPHPLPLSFFDTSEHRGKSPSSNADTDVEAAVIMERAATKEEGSLHSSSPGNRPSSPAVSLGILEAGLSPQTHPQSEQSRSHSPTASLNLLELGLSPHQHHVASPTLGDKRAVSPQLPNSKAAPSPMLKQARTAVSPEQQEIRASEPPPGVDKRLYARYRADWRVNRPFYPEQFFYPSLFNPARLQHVCLPRRRRPIPRRYSFLTEDENDPGARYRRDWQVYRKYDVCDFYNPQLFDEGHLSRVQCPLGRKARKRRFRESLKAMGITDLSSAAARLRLDNKVSRTYPVEQYYEPALFEANDTPSETLRADWYVRRPHDVTEYYNPMLFDLRYNQKKAHNVHHMLKRLASGVPRPYPTRIKAPVTDAGQKYRQDWQVKRAHNVDEFFDPELFDEERAAHEAPYWRSLVERFNGPTYGQAQETVEAAIAKPTAPSPLTPPLEMIAIPVAPQSPSLLVSPAAGASEGRSSPKGTSTPLPFDFTPSTSEVINELYKSLGERNEKGQLYDWPYWRWFFAEDGDRDPEKLLAHIHDEKFAPLPQALLPILWTALAGEPVANQDRYNEILLGGHQEAMYADRLTADVDASELPEEAQRQQLFRLVAAYLNYDPDFVYTPALTVIAKPLVAAGLSDEGAFAALTHIMMTKGHRDLLQGADQDEDGGPAPYVLETLLSSIDPELVRHLQHHGVSADSYAPNWYHTLFAGWIPDAFRQQYLSSYMVEGEVASHRLALALLIENRESLLMANSFGDIMDIILSGQLSMVHPEWNDNYKVWMSLMRQVPLSSDAILQLICDYKMIVQEKHEQKILSTMTSVRREHTMLGGYMAWIVEEIQRLCADRERLYLELLEWHNDCNNYRERICRQRRHIHLLESDLLTLEKDHQEDVSKLNALLASEPLPMAPTADRHHPLQRKARRQKTPTWEK